MAVRYFTVTGRGRFPFDMLRYDQCWPCTQEDVTIMCNDRELSTERSVTLMTNSTKGVPMGERWSSFGWRSGKAESYAPPRLGALGR